MRGSTFIGIGSGTVALARVGLADRRCCAVHWEQFPLFREQFPEVIAVQTAFEEDGNLHTCAGGDAPFDMFVQLIVRDHGALVAKRICEKAIAFRMRSAGDRQRLPAHSRVRVNHRAILKVIDLMEASLDDPLHVDQLVNMSGVSRRQLERLFERELGRSPGRYYLELRLERASLLLADTNLPIVEVAVACGFVSASHFSKVYRDVYGCVPTRTRSIAQDSELDQANGQARGASFHQKHPMAV